ncbi:glycosyltransferase family 9 protein [Longimicrobium sp.]|uniref:glycosyltransferase family 9 protein n=1 Tax=Longimicrobium sp. TaxID=2029185 RepID=UPI002CB53997|nr:glycosyltransferase family 9 protein [Longimicrobium sp.]HSU12950.1 glycosyltransferase family 9 protein [Longimicrobium sp.]
MSELRYPARHVCIVLLTGLGDVVHGLPLVNALKDDDPERRITWVVEPMPAPLLEGHPSIDRVVVYRKKDGLRGVARLARDLAAGERIDLALNLNVYTKSVWPTLLSRARHRLGFDRGRSFEGVWLASNHHLDPRPRAHTADMFLEFAEHLGLAVPHPEWRIRFTDDERRAQAEFFTRFEGRRVATIIPASANAKKDWPAERWARVADALAHDFGFRVVLAGGPGQREQRFARDIVAASSAKPHWALGDSIRRLAWIVAGSSLVLAPDTGPVHIARAFGVPVIGLYGHTNPWRVGPWRKYHDLWVDRYTEPGEAPDPSNFTPRLGRMERITVEDVVAKIALATENHLRSA